MSECEFTCDEDGLLAARQFLDGVCDAPKPSIIFDEIVSNIVRCSGATRFTMAVDRVANGGLAMRFSDNGKPFDPLHDAPEPDVGAPLEDREIGGLGLFMVRKMSKTIGYARQDGWNVLTLTV